MPLIILERQRQEDVLLKVADLPELEAHLNRALAADMPPRVRRKARIMALDLHDVVIMARRRKQLVWGYGGAPRKAPTVI